MTRFLSGGIDALEDCNAGRTGSGGHSNEKGEQIVKFALNEQKLSPRELAVTFTDRRGWCLPMHRRACSS